MRFYTTQLISSNLELTPEGFLLCRNVPIARTGVQLYLESELLKNDGSPMVRGNKDGIVRIERDPAVVFDQATIASFEGKPVTIDHPPTDVNPDNWGRLAKGIVQNVRRGNSLDADYLIADLLITSADAIAEVREKGIREVSCGYDSGYEEIEPGRGRQTNIVGNHVALVEKGRCGSRCAIGDSDSMKNKVKFIDRFRAAFKNRDEAAAEAALKELESTSDEETETEEEKKKREKKEAEDRKTADALADLTARLSTLEKTKDGKSKDEETDEEKKAREEKEAKEKEAKEKEAKEKEGKSNDSAALLAEAQDVRSRVEILSPGMAVPTHDGKADAKTVRDSHCALKRAALTAAYASPKTRDAVTPLLAGVDLQKLSCDALHSTFVGASEIVRHTNNAQSKGTKDGVPASARVADSIAAMNRKNTEFWKCN